MILYLTLNKHRVHEFIAFKLKLAKSQQGNCSKGLILHSVWSNTTDHVQVADLPAICQTLHLDLTVYTLDDNLNSLKLYESGIEGSPICLHLDQPKNHYMLLRTLVEYAETIISLNIISMAKHQNDQNSSKVLVFKDDPIQSSSSLYKQLFGTELVRPLFLAYDFECILKKMKNRVVMLAGGCLADQARNLEYEHCGPDAGKYFKPRNAAANTLCSIGHGVKKLSQQINHAGVVTINPPRTSLMYGLMYFLGDKEVLKRLQLTHHTLHKDNLTEVVYKPNSSMSLCL
ncbi:hypothetical protein PROFUN_07850 [Planoprotostelium fungivorum]|uniref:Uncharacterized protein n=1 Tax=Planoprotostelium fungivorum TaxID=1890364 RepID=A0A2P6NLF2_9EUKA|nr:hypothetical protein PROFUN_07850 [Planoprotostelium fungivorum]